VPVKLTDAQLIERAESIATKLGTVEHLRRKKADDAKSTQALIDTELDEIQRLARVIRDAEEMRKQGELRFDEQPNQAEAQAALAKVAEVAGAVEAELAEVSETPTVCGKCGAGVKAFAGGWMCELPTCTWVAKLIEAEVMPAVVIYEPTDDEPVCDDCGARLANERERVQELCDPCYSQAHPGADSINAEKQRTGKVDRDAVEDVLVPDDEPEGVVDEIKRARAKRAKRTGLRPSLDEMPGGDEAGAGA
jgi:hypothetical protein